MVVARLRDAPGGVAVYSVLLLVVYCEPSNEEIRLISARKANKTERAVPGAPKEMRREYDFSRARRNPYARLAGGRGLCFATDRITVDGYPVGYMYREEPDWPNDSGWRFLAGDEPPGYVNNPAQRGCMGEIYTIAAAPGVAMTRRERARRAAQQRSVVLAFDVTSLRECQARLERLGAPCIQPPHDEGFGQVASFGDPEGNQFEIVELTYQFEGGRA